MNKTLRRVLMLVLAVIFVVSAGMFGRDTFYASREKTANQALADQVHAVEDRLAGEEADPAEDPGPAPEGQEAGAADTGGILPQYQSLYAENHDLAGWLTVPDTPIDYPVMYTPGDRDHYLRKAFDGSYSLSGSLFIAAPWTAPHTLIYGHHMKNGTMFGSLQNYEDPAYYDSHKTILFSTLTEKREYEVMACFLGQAVAAESNFQYWDYADLSDPARFQDYVDRVGQVALYDTGITAQPGDQLLTLSTCSYHVTDGRFAVVARRVK